MAIKAHDRLAIAVLCPGQATQGVRPTDVIIEVYAGSAVVRVTIGRQDHGQDNAAGMFAPIEVDEIVSHFSAAKIEEVPRVCMTTRA